MARPDSDHAVSYYRIIEKAGNNLAWLEMEPYTGRTHQLRVHAAYIGHPIIGDPKYFEADQNWEFPGGIQKRLHLHARRVQYSQPFGRDNRCHGSVAAAYGAIVEPARF